MEACMESTIEVRNRVCRALSSGVNPILHYVVVEFAVARFNESHCTTMCHSPKLRAEYGANEVAHS